ncbi:MAG TPA: hypothetical protein VKB69_01580 [Micromonosporaceae bacterium]|nr:hypothetical protein [Micromonosporaceae bacterium]
MTAWDEYLAAVAQLDDVRRQAEASAETQRVAVRAATDELATVRTRIALQRGRLTEIAVQTRQRPPGVDPLPAERVAAAAVVEPATSDPTPGVGVAIQGIRATLDAADATLSAASVGEGRRVPLSGWPPRARNAVIYGWHALLALIAVLEIAAILGASPQAKLLLAGFALIGPAGAWLLGWITVRVLFGGGGRPRGRHWGPPAADGSGPRGGLLGAAICAVPLVVGMFLSVV